jgi:hypothetical protein
LPILTAFGHSAPPAAEISPEKKIHSLSLYIDASLASGIFIHVSVDKALCIEPKN